MHWKNNSIIWFDDPNIQEKYPNDKWIIWEIFNNFYDIFHDQENSTIPNKDTFLKNKETINTIVEKLKWLHQALLSNHEYEIKKEILSEIIDNILSISLQRDSWHPQEQEVYILNASWF
jgi:hypothetical protein